MGNNDIKDTISSPTRGIKNDNDIFSETSSLRVVVSIPSGEWDPEVVPNSRQPRKRIMKKSATAAAAAAVMVLTYRSSGTVKSIISTSSSLLGIRTSRKQGESCGGFSWWNGSCDNGLSCFTAGNSNYCVPEFMLVSCVCITNRKERESCNDKNDTKGNRSLLNHCWIFGGREVDERHDYGFVAKVFVRFRKVFDDTTTVER